MSTKVAVVIPVYREKLTDLEKISLDRCRKVLRRYPLIFVAPEGKNFSYFAAGDAVAKFPAQYFQNTQTYSQLMMSLQFYEAFSDFDYILIYQLDAFVFYDALEEFCSLGYDYIGAPWPRHAWLGTRLSKTPQVGNGGFCLRKVSACHKLLKNASAMPNWTTLREKYLEDAFFATCGVADGIDFNVAPVPVAELFSMERYPDRHVKKIDGLPFGCHNWQKFGADFYTELFQQFGYDLRPFRAPMNNEDYQFELPAALTKLALDRLIRRVEHGQPLLHYLPTQKFASVRVVRSSDAVKILARLLTEDNSLADKIFIGDADSPEKVFADLSRENLANLLLAADDAALIKAVEQRGLRYGEHFISFRQEYLKRCEEIFHMLGKGRS